MFVLRKAKAKWKKVFPNKLITGTQLNSVYRVSSIADVLRSIWGHSVHFLKQLVIFVPGKPATIEQK